MPRPCYYSIILVSHLWPEWVGAIYKSKLGKKPRIDGSVGGDGGGGGPWQRVARTSRSLGARPGCWSHLGADPWVQLLG